MQCFILKVFFLLFKFLFFDLYSTLFLFDVMILMSKLIKSRLKCFKILYVWMGLKLKFFSKKFEANCGNRPLNINYLFKLDQVKFLGFWNYFSQKELKNFKIWLKYKSGMFYMHLLFNAINIKNVRVYLTVKFFFLCFWESCILLNLNCFHILLVAKMSMLSVLNM